MGRTAFITGATSGIGKATAELLAQQGYRLIICGRRAEVLEELKEKLSSKTEVYALVFDVRNAGEVERSIASLPESFKDIDILINNAGNAHGLEPLSDGNISDWDMMMDANVKGLLYVSKPIISRMKEVKRGHIINISSVAARQTYANGVVYCASKRAVETDFSKVRFKGDEARAKAVYEGYEALKAEDIADAVAYCINAPERVSIAELCIYPKAQAEPRTICR
ncbi:SDR family NAD(P)-dependent oxidoreductase [Riemerella anatipestifer]|uniref:SDR family NAD(P)-dependent oxidoreductase n=1 Tax=Riemerella anatipestifer TaxID=34085 RepID=UPI0007ED3DDD|nr:SDR family NAD(P)-dependent oxidoreductase [Riemerella anatipestifer]OBP38787.1 NAD(P)-dependent oxidoreductase [Riemerella anatipestifer]OBP61372.1 NAD(P)-dependent oxidoreductase [Riemerella anatipestifer]